MATKKKLLQAAAGSAGGGGLNVEDVFSTYLYDGTSAEQSITNNIDLSGEGGSLWIKNRNNAGANHHWFNTENGRALNLMPNQTYAGQTSTATQDLKSFNSDGFTLNATPYNTNINLNGDNYASWTFRKAPKFFTCLTYTGNGTTNRQIPHDLGSAPGCIIVKRTNGLKDWAVYHRGKGNTHYGTLNTNEKFYDSASWWQDTDPTSTNFTVGNSAFVNANGDTYVAYLFAHNDGDGEFGPDGDQDIIKCGSYNDTSSQDINLGFEPQWILVKDIDATDGNWGIMDTMRGWLAPDGNHQYVIANGSQNEQTTVWVSPTSTGFKTPGFGNNYIYIAIRRGPMAVPEDATDVFDITFTNQDSTSVQTDLDRTDVNWQKSTGGDYWFMQTRLRGSTNYLKLDNGSQEFAYGSARGEFDTAGKVLAYTSNNNYIYSFKRAPNFFDSVVQPIVNNQLKSDGAANNYNCVHNLGVTPEFIVVKDLTRAPADGDYRCYHSALGTSSQVRFNEDGSAISGSWQVNENNFNYYNFATPTGTAICMLWASLAGISKVGSYTGTGGYVLNDCGFSSGARLVIVKRTDANGDWYLWDAERGITSGNDPYYLINSANGSVTNTDYIQPDSSGFYIHFNAPAALNASGGNYIFLAIA